MRKTYEIEFIDLSEDAVPFEPMVRFVDGKNNADARINFKKEMKSEFGVIEGKDYKIEHIFIHTPLRHKMKISEEYFDALEIEKNYGRYEIGYKKGVDVYFTGQIIKAKNQKDAIDEFMIKEPNYIRKNVRANRI